MAADLRTVIAEAIEEWAITAFHPGAVKPNDPTLARYIECKIRSLAAEAWPGVAAQHSVITPACRTNRGDEGAFDEAVERARAEYGAVVEGWRKWHPQPTIHLVLTVDRPRTKREACEVPPEGWRCTRARGHDGPCAAVPA